MQSLCNIGVQVTSENTRWMIAPMTEAHWPAVRAIYLQGLASGNATFETAAPDWAEWDARHLSMCRLIALRSSDILGWAALSEVSSRYGYRGVAEVSIYTAENVRRQGIASALLRALVAESERNGIWTLQAGILAENEASIHLHEKAGFRVVGRRERIGCLNGNWRDTILLERRSRTVAT